MSRFPHPTSQSPAILQPMRIASWNVNSLNVRLPHLRTWLESEQPDIVGLQELKLTDDKFPHAELAALGYRALANGQKTYNGVALLYRDGEPQDVVRDLPGFDDPQRRVIAATFDDIRVINLYVVNGQSLESDKYAYKLQWLAALRDWLSAELQRHERLIVMGDFNIAPEDRDVYDPQGWGGDVLCSPAERSALQSLLDLGLRDSFRLIEQNAGLYSWWDYRQGAFRRNHGLRIDLILISAALDERLEAVGIDREPRSWESPSDHAPVWAAFA